MPQEIISEKEIALNEKVYQITGKVNRFLASQFAPKQVIGGYDDESDPVVSTFTWRDQGAGLGFNNIFSTADGNKYSYGNAWPWNEGHLTMGPWIDSAGPAGGSLAVGSDSAFYADFDDSSGDLALWMAGDGAVKYFDGDTTWTASKVTPKGKVSDFKAGVLNDSAILIFATDSGNIQYSNSPSDTTAWSSDSSFRTVKFAFWRDLLWGMTDSGEMAFTPDITSGWTQIDGRLRTDTGQLIELLVAPSYRGGEFEESLYAATKSGLFRYDNENERFISTGLQLPRSRYAAATEWNGAIYYSAGLNVFRFTPGPANVIENVGPSYIIEANPIGAAEAPPLAFTSLASGISGVYAATTAAFPNNYFGSDRLARVLYFNGRGWSMFRGPDAVNRAGKVFISGAYDQQRLFVGATNAGLDTFTGTFQAHLPVVSSDLFTDTSMYLGGTDHRYPWFDGLVGGEEKLAVSVEIEVTAPDTTESVSVSYRTQDDTGLFHGIGSTIRIEGTKTLTFNITDTNGDVGAPFNKIQLALTLQNAAAAGHLSHTPDVRRLSLRYIKGQSLRWGFRVGIKGSEQQSATELHTELESLFTTNRLHELTFRNDKTGSPETHIVKAVDLQSAEESGYGQDADYVLTLVEAV